MTKKPSSACYKAENLAESSNPSANNSWNFNIHKGTYPKLKGFKIGHLNITSLSKHKDELAIFISEQPFDIICLNETRLDCSNDNSEVGIPGYDLVRKDRNRNGGEVAIYLRDTIPYTDRADLIPDVAEAIYNGNCTEWSAIWSEIKRMITKSHDREAGVRFVITSLISDQNCTTRSAISTLLHSF